MLSLGNGVQWVILVGVEVYRPPHTSTEVWLCTFCHFTDFVAWGLPTLYDYSGSGTFQEGHVHSTVLG